MNRVLQSTIAAIALLVFSLPVAADNHRTMSREFMSHMQAVFEFQGKNQHTEAIGYINTLLNGDELELNPYEQATLLQSRGMSYFSVDLLFEASGDFQAAIATGTLTEDETFNRRRSIAQLQQLSGQYDQAIATYELLIESGHPDTLEGDFLNGLAQIYAMAEDWPKAQQAAEAFWAATSEDAREASDYRFVAFIFEQAGDTDRAEELIRQRNERFPEAQ